MNLLEALDAVRQATAVLDLDADGPVLRGPGLQVSPEVIEVLKTNRDRLTAVLRLRRLHREMGLSEEDALLAERAILSGQVETINVVPAPAGMIA